MSYTNYLQPVTTSFYNPQIAKNMEMARRMGEIDQNEISSVAQANQAASERLNTAAMASERRRAGGTTFRRRGSGVSANQLVSGLGAANAKALADARRKAVAKEVEAGVGWGSPVTTVSVGPAFGYYY